MTNDDTAADDAPFVQTHPLPANIDPQIITGMAHAHELRVVKIRTWVITLEGREADQSAFADRLEQLTQLPGFGLVRRWKGPVNAGFLCRHSFCGAK